MEPINFGHPMYGTPTKHKTRRKNEHLRACKAWKARHGALMAWFQYVSVPLGQPVYHSLPQWLVELILKKTVHAIRSSFFVDETILDVDPLCSVSNFGPTMIAICWIIMPKRCDEIYLTPLYSYIVVMMMMTTTTTMSLCENIRFYILRSKNRDPP